MHPTVTKTIKKVFQAGRFVPKIKDLIWKKISIPAKIINIMPKIDLTG